MTSLALNFNNVQFDIVDRDNQPWIKSRELANALGYADEKSINRIYQRNADEFTPCMVGGVNLTTPSGEQETRIFSLRGCHLLAMFARTAIAKQFRKWVLDVLDKTVSPAQPQIPHNPHLAIRKTIEAICKGNRSAYKAVYQKLYDMFQVEKYTQIPVDQCVSAIEFIRSLEGEYLPRDKIEAPKPFALCDGQHYIVTKDGVPLFRELLSDDVNKSCLTKFKQGNIDVLKTDLAYFLREEQPEIKMGYHDAQEALRATSVVLDVCESHGLKLGYLRQQLRLSGMLLCSYWTRLDEMSFHLDRMKYMASVQLHPSIATLEGVKFR